MPQIYADLAVPLAVDKTFTYLVPREFHQTLKRGMRVIAPLGKRKVVGFVINTYSKRPEIQSIKEILDVLDSGPVLSEEMLRLSDWMSEYYFTPLGSVFKALLVQGSALAGKRTVRLNFPADEINPQEPPLSQQETAILGEISKRKVTGVSQLQRKLGSKNLYGAINELARMGIISIKEEFPQLARENSAAAEKRTLLRAESAETEEPALDSRDIRLNPDQQNALQAISDGIGAGKFRTYLLHGVTGSGKTQVYIEAIRRALELGKTAIVLVPEISLTPQTVRRFRLNFGENISVLHSRISRGERYSTWRAALDGKSSIVIGARSAVFAPLKNLGLIVVDEEQEASYKQFDQTPRYHARDVAIMRAYYCDAVVILGSATPSLESYSNAASNKYTLLQLPVRADGASLPVVAVVDMTAERKKKLAVFMEKMKDYFRKKQADPAVSRPKFEFSPISDLLNAKIEDRLQKGEGIILLQNRRGFSPIIECPDCGHVEMCDRCSISLTYHLTQKHLRCHYCGSVKSLPSACPSCRSAGIRHRGFGTQRIEEELRKLFPLASTVRMDLDTTTGRGSHSKILKKFSTGEADILLGTQMVAKGLDFSRVSLVGVISADTQMLLPDFRSAERTFQMLTQVAGRAGRSKIAGEVIIQTCQPGNYSLQHATTHDYGAFYNREINFRKELGYPPFSRLILIEFKGTDEKKVNESAAKFSGILKELKSQAVILGPAPAAITKLKGDHRWHIVLKILRENDPSGQIAHRTLNATLEKFGKSVQGKAKSVKVTIDVDPVGMM